MSASRRGDPPRTGRLQTGPVPVLSSPSLRRMDDLSGDRPKGDIFGGKMGNIFGWPPEMCTSAIPPFRPAMKSIDPRAVQADDAFCLPVVSELNEVRDPGDSGGSPPEIRKSGGERKNRDDRRNDDWAASDGGYAPGGWFCVVRKNSRTAQRVEREGQVGSGLEAAVGRFFEAAVETRSSAGGMARAMSEAAGGSSLRMACMVSTDVGLRKARLPVSIS